ncbi:MAG: hypothetical protein K2X91_09600 [Thermoleophilia bacterium]|nr:hypothetical protein [Thermoleophilia bacterium]
MMKEGGVILVEGAIIEREGCSAEFFDKRPYLGDDSNWWVPTRECLRQWVECSCFAIDREFGEFGAETNNPRMTLLAQAVRQADPYSFRPDADLAEYDLNVYPRGKAEMPAATPAPPAGLTAATPGRTLIPHPAEDAIPAQAGARRWLRWLARQTRD